MDRYPATPALIPLGVKVLGLEAVLAREAEAVPETIVEDAGATKIAEVLDDGTVVSSTYWLVARPVRDAGLVANRSGTSASLAAGPREVLLLETSIAS